MQIKENMEKKYDTFKILLLLWLVIFYATIEIEGCSDTKCEKQEHIIESQISPNYALSTSYSVSSSAGPAMLTSSTITVPRI